MIKAKYKQVLVTGTWFCLGDDFWLLLSKAASKRVSREAVALHELTDVSKYP